MIRYLAVVGGMSFARVWQFTPCRLQPSVVYRMKQAALSTSSPGGFLRRVRATACAAWSAGRRGNEASQRAAHGIGQSLGSLVTCLARDGATRILNLSFCIAHCRRIAGGRHPIPNLLIPFSPGPSAQHVRDSHARNRRQFHDEPPNHRSAYACSSHALLQGRAVNMARTTSIRAPASFVYIAM
jgi:hypothetical protein